MARNFILVELTGDDVEQAHDDIVQAIEDASHETLEVSPDNRVRQEQTLEADSYTYIKVTDVAEEE